ncbi:hypothetical protein [Labedella endophytica]|uniref:Uncharacterized protein n=1 Tax=Labedella endophytica TaxID=1523160 RepID=A0A433JW49_9MICO|nr:hypothetical protein [Labedella endophytica]RUR03381.1 hypothetical protein ELQ94_02205 [Labedella endophytica]
MIGDEVEEEDERAPVPGLTRASLALSALGIVVTIAAYVGVVAGLSGSAGLGVVGLFPLGAIAAGGCAILAFVLAVAAIVRARGFGNADSATHAALLLSVLLAAPVVIVGAPMIAGGV